MEMKMKAYAKDLKNVRNETNATSRSQEYLSKGKYTL